MTQKLSKCPLHTASLPRFAYLHTVRQVPYRLVRGTGHVSGAAASLPAPSNTAARTSRNTAEKFPNPRFPNPTDPRILPFINRWTLPLKPAS